MMHFTQSPDPPHFHMPGPIQTMCKKMLADVELSFAFDGEICGRNLKEVLGEMGFNGLQVCQKCLRGEFTERYLSGIRPRTEDTT